MDGVFCLGLFIRSSVARKTLTSDMPAAAAAEILL